MLATQKYKVLLGFTGGLLLTAPAHAHYPWITMPNFYPEEGKALTVYTGNGHIFPLDGFLSKEQVQSVELVSPEGKKTTLEANETGYLTPEFETAGTYLVVATQKSSFYTRTKEGPKRQSKEGLSDVVKCSYSVKNMKAIVNAGGGTAPSTQRFSQALEIIPLSNPADVRVGDFMKVQVMMNDEPHRGEVFATYGGFSAEGAYAYTIGTDNEGKASIRMLQPGQWLIRVKAERPYPDTKVCDVESHTTTLTFGIR